MKRRTLSLFFALALVACSSSEDEPNPNGDTDTGETDVGDTSPTPDDTGDGDTGDVDVEPGDTDTGGDTVDEIIVPASSVINEYRTHADPPRLDEDYLSKETTYFRVGHELGSAQPLAIREIEGQIFLGTETGLLVLDPVADAFEPWFVSPTGKVEFIAPAVVPRDDINWLLTIVDGLPTLVSHESEYDYVSPLDGLSVRAHAVAFDGWRIWAATDEGLWFSDSTGVWEQFAEFQDLAISDVATGPNDELLFTTDQGFFMVPDEEGETVQSWQTDQAFRAADWCPDGSFVVVSEDNLVIVNGSELSELVPGAEGLPSRDNLSVRCPADGLYFVGHAVGASLLGGERNLREHYSSGRWTLGKPALALELDENRSRWILSTEGVTRVDLVPRSLEEKAMVRHEALEDRFRRLDGFISAQRNLMDWFSWEGSYLPDKDNDGLWTQMMIGTWAYAYGVTGDESYCDAARQSIQTMMRLIELPCISFTEAGKECGFIARSIVRDDEGEVYDSKLPLDNWHLVEPGDGHSYQWKDDTSSDEIDGHNYGFPLYYDFCATDDEKEEITAAYLQMLNYIINNGYTLVRLDGEKTTYGHWNPERMSSCVDGFATCMRNVGDAEICGSSCFGGGYLNGMQILGGLLAAWHMSGDEFYYLEYERLIREHRYDEVITNVAQVQTLHNWSIENHSDHELMMLAYHTLIRYEPNPERLARWQAAMLEMYETERIERQPLWVAFVAGLTGEVMDLDEALDSLQRYPWDARDWLFDNSHRADITNVGVVDRREHQQVHEVLPYDEMGYVWWNLSPHRLILGGSREETAPTAYLIAYWSLRYYGLLDQRP